MEHMVSVCMSTCNHAAFIEEAIEGVMMQQTDFPFQLVIGEDLSSDTTLERCLAMKEKYGARINLLPSDKKYGQNKNLHRIINACEGKYIAFCEGDDAWTATDKLQKQIDFLESHPDHVMCFHKIFVEDASTGIIELPGGNNKILNYEGYDFFHIFIPTLSIVFRNCLTEFPAEFFSIKSTDAFIFAMLSEFGKGADLGFIGGKYRKHEGGCYNSLSVYGRFRQSIHTRKKMKDSSFFNAYQKKEIRHELKKREILYCKYFLKKGRFVEFFKMSLFILAA